MKEFIIVMQNIKNQFINIQVRAESKEKAVDSKEVKTQLRMGSRLISVSEIKEWFLMLNALIFVVVGLSLYIVKELVKERKTKE